MFETPLEKSNSVLPGRNRGTHPYVMYFKPNQEKNAAKGRISLTLIGKASEYLPYIYFALRRAGETGIFKQRTKYVIDDVTIGEESILDDPNTLNVSYEETVWSPAHNHFLFKRPIKIEFLSPLRIKIKGRYTDKLSLHDIFYALLSRVKLITTLWGEDCKMLEALDIETIKNKVSCVNIVESIQVWKDYSYFSSRQHGSMKLGGVTGKIVISGLTDKLLMSLLSFGEIFHFGKNTSFGFGKLNIEEAVC
jgi:CRISPR-associated endoribonuclease Cas6